MKKLAFLITTLVVSGGNAFANGAICNINPSAQGCTDVPEMSAIGATAAFAALASVIAIVAERRRRSK